MSSDFKEEEFIFVLKSKKSKRIAKSMKNRSLFTEVSLRAEINSNTETDSEVLILERRLNETLDIIADACFVQDLIRKVSDLNLDQIVSFGIGNFSFLDNSFFQLTVLVQLQKFLKLSKKCIIFDPVFTNIEIAFLKHIGFEVFLINDECCFNVGDQKTLFFMIHCGTAMYNNVLWANFTPDLLKNVAFLGNSFEEIKQVAELNKNVDNDSFYIRKLDSCYEETKIEPEKSSELFLAFTGTSLHIVNSEILSSKSGSFWSQESLERPKYENFSSIILDQDGDRFGK